MGRTYSGRSVVCHWGEGEVFGWDNSNALSYACPAKHSQTLSSWPSPQSNWPLFCPCSSAPQAPSRHPLDALHGHNSAMYPVILSRKGQPTLLYHSLFISPHVELLHLSTAILLLIRCSFKKNIPQCTNT